MSNSSFFVDLNYAAVVDQVPSYTGVQRQTSAQALAVALHWGTRRITPNIIWQSNLVTLDAIHGPTGSPPYGMAPVGNVTTNPGTVTAITDAGGPEDTSSFIEGGRFQSSLRIAHTGGGTSSYGTTSTWWVPAIYALCEGPITIPLDGHGYQIIASRVWNGGGQAAIPYQDPGGGGIFSGAANPPNPVPSIFYWAFPGDGAQNAWPFLTTWSLLYPGQALAYRHLALIASAVVDYGENNKPPQQSFEILKVQDASYGQTDSYLLGTDMSPAFFVPDFLTNTQYGAGLASGDIDATSLALYKAYTFAQGLYFSPLLDTQAKATDIIDRWAQLSNTWIFWSGTAIMMAPLGDETITGNGQMYTPDKTAAYNLSNDNFLGPLQVDRADPIDCFNRVRLQISDRISDYATVPLEWKNSTLINLYGLRDASDVSGDDICDSVVGAKVVELIGKRMAYVRNTYTFTLSYRFVRILPGTILTVSDPNLGIAAVPVRVLSVEEDDGFNLRIVAEEYPGTLGISRPSAVQGWSGSGGAGAGTSGSSGSGSGGTVSTTGGGITLTTPITVSAIFFVAGDVITLPATMTSAQVVAFIHDQQRVPQPTPADLEANPVTFVRGVGATYLFEDPQDRSIAAASVGPSGNGSSCTGRVSGATYYAMFDGGSPGIVRWLETA